MTTATRSKHATSLGVDIHWPDKRKRPFASVTPADSTWLTMCGMAELWPSIMRELFPYLSTEIIRVLDAWAGAGFGETSLVDLLWPNGGPHREIVERYRCPSPVACDLPPHAVVHRPRGLKFLRGELPVQIREANLLRLVQLLPDTLSVQRPSQDVVTVSINYAVIRECMVARMNALPAYTVLYSRTWPGKYAALFAAETPVDTTLKTVR